MTQGPGPARPPSIRRRRATLPAPPSAAILPLLFVGALLAWWAWKSGAYFGAIFLPGAIALLALTAAMLLFAPWPAALRGGARLALGCLVGLAGWTLLSILWTPAREVAVADTQRVVAYAAAFALGTWTCLLLGRRMQLALTPLVGAGALVGIVTLGVLWTGSDISEFLDEEATLRYPLGYRNAVAAFFLIALFPTVVLAASRDLDWRLRGLLLGCTTLMVELVVLAQSRSSIFAAVVGVAVLIAVHPARLRILAWLALPLIPAVLALPWLLEVFQTGAGNSPESLPPLRDACAAITATSVFGLLLGLAVARAEPAFALSPRSSRRIGVGLLGCLAVVLGIGIIALARAEGGPTGFLDRHIDEISAGTPDLTEQGSRFGFNLGSSRGDFWRVAADDFAANPLLGTGAGGFRSSYLADRDANTVQPEDPHSIELLMASELGLPGVLLFALFAAGATVGVLRARRLGPSAAALAAAALAVGAYWLAHASVEWFWSYPAITLPVLFALGAAAAPALLRPSSEARRRFRLPLAAAVTLLALSMVPFLLAERYTNSGLRTGAADLDSAYSDLRKAADLNPLSDQPLAAEAVIAEAAGDRQRALAALDRAERREPTEWTLYYLEARLLAPIDPDGARRALEEAHALNPRGVEVAELGEELGIGL
ncbi:MAG: O-antigen ligase family protein [Solirubrobacterales bacterium]